MKHKSLLTPEVIDAAPTMLAALYMIRTDLKMDQRRNVIGPYGRLAIKIADTAIAEAEKHG